MIEDRASVILLDEENPWPALSPFDEAGQQFFHGRRDETAALWRIVLQAQLTVLFGKSGLGKTSLLRAGLFPQLRAHNILPIYLRLNVQEREHPLVDQLAEAFQAKVSMYCADAMPIGNGETLWQYLHRASFEIWSPRNQLLTPLFVLDQFEEIFTLGPDNPSAVTQFRVDLADLVENRIPAQLGTQSEKSEAATLGLDLQNQRYKVLVSFREDFLPAIEGWKKEMPSLLKNRLRLLPMTGPQAFDAVHETAPKLADRSVAQEIVRFVAAVHSTNEEALGISRPSDLSGEFPASSGENAGLDGLVVEPALLSLVCHGLNERRKSQRKAAFDSKLLQGTGRVIIDDFYERSVTDLPGRVQRFIETELITERGYRKPCAIDDARSGYEITDGELRALVNRRLLRLEPYQGIERVELIHDVLTPVVRQRRDRQRELARQAEAEVEAVRRRQRTRLRALTVGLSTALVILGAVGWLAYWAFGQKELAETALRTSRARQIAAAGSARAEVEPDLAALLAIESLRVERTDQGESLLRQALVRTQLSIFRGQSEPIRAVALSADARRLATVSEDGTTWIWDVESKQVLHRLAHGDDGATAVAFAPHGKFVVTAGRDRKVRIWWADTGLERYQLSLPKRHSPNPGFVPSGIRLQPGERSILERISLVSLAFNPRGRWLAAGSEDGQVALWDLSSRTLAHVWDISEHGRRPSVSSVMFNADGEQLLAGSGEGTARVWQLSDTARRPKTFSLDLGDLILRRVALSPDDRLLVVAAARFSGDRPVGVARLVDAITGKEVRELRGGHTGAVMDAAFSTDGRTVITAGSEGTVCIWDAQTGNLERVVRGHAGKVLSLGVSPLGTVFASGGEDKTARIWSVSTLSSKAFEGHHGQATSVAFSADGQWIVSGGMDRTVRVWDINKDVLAHKLEKHKSDVLAIAVNRDGMIASAGGGILSGGDNGDAAIRLWDINSGALVREITANRFAVLGAAFTPDGKTLATTGNGAVVRLWDVGTGELRKEMQWSDKQGVGMHLAFSPDGKLIAVAGGDSVTRILDYDSGKVVKELAGHKSQGMLSSSVFGDNGKRLLVTSLVDPDIVVWDVPNGTAVHRFKGYDKTNGADFSHDGVLAVTADQVGSPKLWDVKSGALLASLSPQKNARGVAFSPEGRQIATTSSSGAILIWDCPVCAPLPELRDAAEKRLGRTLTPDELRTILGE